MNTELAGRNRNRKKKSKRRRKLNGLHVSTAKSAIAAAGGTGRNSKAKFEPGLYRHYKGGLYRALFLAQDHETRKPHVVYVSMIYHTVNIRPLEGPEGWLTPVRLEENGCLYTRFELVQGESDFNGVEPG